ncbi:SURF1 family protein [Novosphingobium sp. MMS21-SN21R]|uniref:SURF1 family protein n=1 Tax=Novosphingobium sp. MMS21-SN21R TaxID=2969298 RepID=UPI002884AC81|nr:SURF1 family protein [Novosphingobium sp. MMS21-SN21R]MDT0507258.1 SURF1 family protein [Novosphingobium sp. MMS21-SN21R]
MRRLPIVPTIIVLIAVGVMIRLGVWQLDRMHEKEAMLARYTAAQAAGTEMPFPTKPDSVEAALYHHSALDCLGASNPTSRSGRNANGDAGIAQIVTCRLGNGASVEVVLGVGQTPATVAWAGGKVTGWIAPGPKLIADPPLAGLTANARPDPNDIPNNHWSYAIQWFLFAAVALIIYVIALRKRWRER